MDGARSRTLWGLFLVQLSLAQIELNITCRFAGVYHVEKNGRYSISRTEAADLCKAFNSTLPTLAQMEQALSIGFETCRYGFIDGHVVIPRKTPRFLCAANNTGVYILASNMSQYDTYCFNASAPQDKEDCSSVTDIPSTFEGQITIGIVNPDGTRYTKKGEYRTNPEDINPTYNTDDDGSSGSAGERSTMGGSTIIQTTYDDVTPTAFKYPKSDDDETFPSITSIDSTSTPADLEPNEENEEETGKFPSYSGSGIDDDEDFISTNRDDSRPGQPRRPDVTSHATPSYEGNQGLSEQTPNPKRQPKIPEWLIILSALLALALILAVCIAVNSRRRCGQKKKLVINNGNGAVDDKKSPGLNGDASKSQEMVNLVYKEPSDGQIGQDEYMNADETRNLQNVDMKIGV
uniref:CD44 antigen n=1 Tax=Sarcophilus harrisii TaxID=9305 RepID=A0A7N4PBP2_SARHA